MKQTIPPEVVKIQRDIATLSTFMERMQDLREDNPSAISELLRTVFATYGLMRLIVSDCQVIANSDKIVEEFIQKFMALIEEHIMVQRAKYCNAEPYA